MQIIKVRKSIDHWSKILNGFFFRNGFLLSLMQSLRKMSKDKFLEIYYSSFLHILERSSNFQIS
jgi:hypothetical protein